ncbi:MAG TPA: hypothetical protein VFR64_03820 [Methylomirabilota bacterium]|nr:hypothetical protein [Methylomirabilota bacterium]
MRKVRTAIRTSAKDISGGGEEDTRAAGLAPDTMIGGAGLRSEVISRMECFLVDHPLDAPFLRIRGEELAGDAGRDLLPFWLVHSVIPLVFA